MKLKYAIGLDIGGTKIASVIVNERGDMIQQEIVKSDPSNREKMFDQVITCLEKLMGHSSIPLQDIYGIGVGVPGKVDINQGIAVYQNNLPWSNFPIVERIKEEFNINKVVIDNDVYMAAFAEWKAAGLTDELFVYMTISTGISVSIIDGGKFVRGAGFAGELGLIPVYAPYELERCKRLEKTASGPALEKHAQNRFGMETMTTETLFQSFYHEEPIAKAIVDDVVSSLTQGVYMINSLLDPHKIVFGGSVATRNPVLLDLMKEKLEDYLVDEQGHILETMGVSNLGNSQGMIGAGLSVFEQLHTTSSNRNKLRQ